MTLLSQVQANEELTQIIRNAFHILASNILTRVTYGPGYPESELAIERVAALIRTVDDLVVYLEANAATDERRQVLLLAQTVREAAYTLMAVMNPEQAWFWTEEWQAGEREADAAIAAGNLLHFESDADFIRHLEAASARDA